MKTDRASFAAEGATDGTCTRKPRLPAFSGLSIQYHARATHRADLMNLELWSESERRRWSIGQCWANGRVWLTWECSGVHVRRGENKQPPSAVPSIAARRHERATPANPPQVGRRRRHQLPARSGCRPPLPHVACDTPDARPPARVASRAPHCRRHTAHSCSGIANTWHPHLDSRRPPPETRLTWR